jgi:hypothetical protein
LIRIILGNDVGSWPTQNPGAAGDADIGAAKAIKADTAEVYAGYGVE